MFSSLSAWIMSIAGVICLSVLVELVLPNGQMNKYIKGIFSFIIILVIVSPIPKLLHKDFDFSSMFGTSEIKVQEDYLYQLNLDKVTAMQSAINQQIEEQGYLNVDARIDSDIFASTIEIKAVYVDISRLVISENSTHKDITEVKKDMLTIVTTIVNINNERVVFNE